MKPRLVAACIIVLFICGMAAAAELPDSAVTIYVEDNSGQRITTGSGVIISKDGVIATDMDIVLAWLESDNNSLFVRTDKNGYYPMKALITVARGMGVALFSVHEGGQMHTGAPPSTEPEKGDKITLLADAGGPEAVSRDGKIIGELPDGLMEISAKVSDMFKGAPAVNSSGRVVGIAVKAGGKNALVPMSVATALSLTESDETAAKASGKISEQTIPNTIVLKKAKAAATSERAGADDYLHLGVAYAKTGMFEEATEAYKKAIEIKPKYAEAYHGLGVAYASLKKYDEAVEAMEKAVQLDSHYTQAFANLGFLYDFLGDYEKAKASFDRAIELEPEFAEAYNGLGVAEARVQHYEDAIEDFKQALRIKPEFAQARFNLGLSYVSMEDKQSAKEEEASLRAMSPDLADQLLEIINAGEKAGGEGGEHEGASEEGGEDEPSPHE